MAEINQLLESIFISLLVVGVSGTVVSYFIRKKKKG